MNKYLPKKITDIKDKVALAELQRTHFIVVVLALALAGILALGMYHPVEFNVTPSSIAIVLLIFVALISLSIALGLRKLIKK